MNSEVSPTKKSFRKKNQSILDKVALSPINKESHYMAAEPSNREP